MSSDTKNKNTGDDTKTTNEEQTISKVLSLCESAKAAPRKSTVVLTLKGKAIKAEEIGGEKVLVKEPVVLVGTQEPLKKEDGLRTYDVIPGSIKTLKGSGRKLLKDTNRLEIEIKELASTIEDMSDAESLLKQQLRDARTRLRSTEQELFDSNFTVTAKSNQLEVEESAARELRDELRDREGKRVRNEHTHKLVTEALEKRVEKSEQEVSELAGQLRDAEEQVRKLTSAMFETDEEAQKMKQTFERLFKEQGESIEDMKTALARKTAEVADLSSRLEESESRLKLAREELDAKQRAEIENSKQIRLLREQIRGLEERLSTKQSDFASITKAYELLKSDKKLTEVRINNLEENLADVTTNLGHEKDKSQHLKDYL